MNKRFLELIQPTHPLSYGNITNQRLQHILKYVHKWSFLPDDITHDEQVALLYDLINPIETENGEEIHRLTEDGEKVLCYFMFGPWTVQI